MNSTAEYLFELCTDAELQEIAQKKGSREELIKAIHKNFAREKQLQQEQEDYEKGIEYGKLYLSGKRLPSYDALKIFSLSVLLAIAKVMNAGNCEGKTTHEIIQLILAKSKELERARGTTYPLNYEQAVTHINNLLSVNGGYYRDGDTWGEFGVNAVWYIMMDCDNAGINDLFKYVTGCDFVSFPRADFYSYNERKEIANCARYIADKIMDAIIEGHDIITQSEAGKIWYENYLSRYPHKEKIA